LPISVTHHDPAFDPPHQRRRDQWELLELAGWRYSLISSRRRFMAFSLRTESLNFKPGARIFIAHWIHLAGADRKRVSGQSLREFTQSRMFRPLDMNNTHSATITPNREEPGYGYIRDRPTRPSTERHNFDTVGATSLLTTVEISHCGPELYQPRVEVKR